MTTLAAFDRGGRGVGVRDLLLVIPSVGCTNRTVELIGAARPDVRVITHQHGCGHLHADLAVTRQVIAGTLANPNVRGGVVVGLGCENNVPSQQVEAARALGATVELSVFQHAGGADATVRDVATLLDRLPSPAARTATPLGGLRIAVLADGGPEEEALARAVADSLSALGTSAAVHRLTPRRADHPQSARTVPAVWRDRPAPPAPADLADLTSDDLVEHLSAVAAAGTQLAVHVTREGTPLASPIVPTVRVVTDPRWEFLADAEPDARAVVDTVLAVAGGATTVAETNGQRDFGIPRLTPTM